MSCGIYKIVNTQNGKTYVGQSVDILKRWQSHKWESEEPKDRSYKCIIHDAFRKYGIDKFEFSILEECSVEMLDEREKHWISELNTLVPNGYNILGGGQKNKRLKDGEYGSPMFFSRKHRCVDCGKILSNKSTKRCLDCVRKRGMEKNSTDEIARLVYYSGSFVSAAKALGKSASALTNVLKRRGLPYHTRELKEWYAKRNGLEMPKPKRIRTGKTIADYSFRVAQYTLDGEFVKEFPSMRQAEKETGIHSAYISQVVRGKCNGKAGGFLWKRV